MRTSQLTYWSLSICVMQKYRGEAGLFSRLRKPQPNKMVHVMLAAGRGLMVKGGSNLQPSCLLEKNAASFGGGRRISVEIDKSSSH